MSIRADIHIVHDPAMSDAQAVLAFSEGHTIIALDPQLTEDQQQALIDELLSELTIEEQ